LSSAVGQGLNACFLSGNTLFRRILLSKEGSEAQSRKMASARFAGSANEWTKFNDIDDGRNSSALLGTTYWLSGSDRDQDLTLLLLPALPPDLASWLLEGTSLFVWNQSPAYLSLGLLLGGHEVNRGDFDSLADGVTPVIGVLAPSGESSDDTLAGTLYCVGVWMANQGGSSSGSIFSAGSVMWGWALDDFAVPGHDLAVSNPARGAYLSPEVQTITKNVLARLRKGGGEGQP